MNHSHFFTIFIENFKIGILAKINKEEDFWNMEFPGAPGCFAFGYSIEEAIINGRESFNEWFKSYLCFGELPHLIKIELIFEIDDNGWHVFAPDFPGCKAYGKSIKESEYNMLKVLNSFYGFKNITNENYFKLMIFSCLFKNFA